METLQALLNELPPFLQLVFGALAFAGVLYVAVQIGNWFEARREKK